MQFSRGLEVTIANRQIRKRLSVNSGVGVLSLQNVLDPETIWPLEMCPDGSVREISSVEKCIVLGNETWRKEILAHETAIIDTTWRSTPLEVWKEVIGEVCGRFYYSPHGQSVNEGDIDADVYGFQQKAEV